MKTTIANLAFPRNRTLALLLLIWTAATAYNLFKPFHIDDTAYLLIAEWIENHPLRPMSGIVNWSGVDEPIFSINQPHLYFYVLALWGRLFGFNEVSLHFLQSFFVLACIFQFYYLADRLTKGSAVWATAMLVLGPAFFVEQNLMTDVPLLALWLTFFSAVIGGVGTSNQTTRYLVAALACCAALLIKYSSLVLCVLLFVSLLVERRWRQFWCLGIPIVIIVAWSAFNYWDFGRSHIFGRSVTGRGFWAISFLASAWISTLGSLTPLGLVTLKKLVSPKSMDYILPFSFVSLVFLAFFVALGVVTDGLSDLMLYVAFGSNGILMLIGFYQCSASLFPKIMGLMEESELEKFYLSMWIFGTFCFYCLFSPFMAARHVLLVIPAFLLLFCKTWPEAFDRQLKRFLLLMTIFVSGGLSISDWAFADFYRQEARNLSAALPKEATVWTSGHWGWQWYAGSQGFRQVDVLKDQIGLGDYLIIPHDVDHQDLAFPVPLQIVRHDKQISSPLAVICSTRPHRLYHSYPGQGSWSFSRKCNADSLTIYRVGFRQRQ